MKKENPIIKYDNLSGILIFIYSAIIIFILNSFYNNYDFISIFIEKGNSYEYIYQLIKDNTKYISGFIIIYLVFLGYIKEKKGVIFGSIHESTTNSKYSHLLLLLMDSINFVLPVFLYYLWINDLSSQFWIVLGTQFIMLPTTAYILLQYSKLRENHKMLVEINETDKEKLKYGLMKFFTSMPIYYIR